MSKRPSMVYQVLECLKKMQAFGVSKHAERAANGGQTRKDRIYSKSTFDTYLAICVHFAKFSQKHFGCRWLREARPYVAAYLRQRMQNGVSPWTLHRDASALAKLYQCTSADFGVKLPPRRRGDVSRYRNADEQVAAFRQNNPELAEACESCGLRRHELRLLTAAEDVRVDDGGHIRVAVRQGKGGRPREIYALGDAMLRLAQQAQAEGREYICHTIPPHAPIHILRQIFAQKTYKENARPVDQIPKQDRYICRGDMAGIILDRRALRTVSKALGHNRVGIVTHYLRRLQ